MILDYNSTKAGVNTTDQMVRAYATKRKARRWPMAVFYNMLDISALNVYVIWLHIHPGWKAKVPHKRRLFLMKLGKQLNQENVDRHKLKMKESQMTEQETVSVPAASVPAKRGDVFFAHVRRI